MGPQVSDKLRALTTFKLSHQVTLGNFLAEIGSLRYTEDTAALPTLLILGIALGVSLPLLLIFLFLLFVCLRRHYSQTHKKPMVKLVPDAAGSLRPMYKNRQSGAAVDGVIGRNGQPLEMVPLKSDEDGARRRLGPDTDGGNGRSFFFFYYFIFFIFFYFLQTSFLC